VTRPLPYLAALAALAPALLAPAGAAAAADPRAEARMTRCEPALEQGRRYLVVQGRMRRVRDAAKLQMRFELQVRLPERPRWARLDAPGFGTWLTADPAPRRYVYSKRVENLTAPAAYRMVVRFRWLDADGRRLTATRRTSERCEQPDLRPDLEPRRVGVTPLTESERRYVVPVRNTGQTAAGPFAVTLTLNGVPLPSVAVTGLAPGREADVALDGPACEPGSVIGVRVDSDATVDEADEADDELLRACPER